MGAGSKGGSRHIERQGLSSLPQTGQRTWPASGGAAGASVVVEFAQCVMDNNEGSRTLLMFASKGGHFHSLPHGAQHGQVTRSSHGKSDCFSN